jgi:hypothetical protein
MDEPIPHNPDLCRGTAIALEVAALVKAGHAQHFLDILPDVASGKALVEACKDHLLEVMSTLPECRREGPGLGQRAIEDAADFRLHLPEYDGYFTWSLLVALAVEGRLEVLQPGKRNKKYRLA